MFHNEPCPPVPKPVAEEVRDYTETAKKIIDDERVAEQNQKITASTKGNDKKKNTSGRKESDKEEVLIVKHKVTMGNTYKTLALRYHTKPNVIKKRNKVSRPLRYMIGRELSIPAGKSYVREPANEVNKQVSFPKLMKAFFREAKECEPVWARYYLLDSKRDVKKALARWREDCEWRKFAVCKQEVVQKVSTPIGRSKGWPKLPSTTLSSGVAMYFLSHLRSALYYLSHLRSSTRKEHRSGRGLKSQIGIGGTAKTLGEFLGINVGPKISIGYEPPKSLNDVTLGTIEMQRIELKNNYIV